MEDKLTRGQFFPSVLITIFLKIYLSFITIGIHKDMYPFLTLIGIGLLYYLFRIVIRRLHDINKSGWFSTVLLIPFLNIFVIIILFFIPSYVDSSESNNNLELKNTKGPWDKV